MRLAAARGAVRVKVQRLGVLWASCVCVTVTTVTSHVCEVYMRVCVCMCAASVA